MHRDEQENKADHDQNERSRERPVTRWRQRRQRRKLRRWRCRYRVRHFSPRQSEIGALRRCLRDSTVSPNTSWHAEAAERADKPTRPAAMGRCARRRGIALQQLDHADHQQDGRPRLAEIQCWRRCPAGTALRESQDRRAHEPRVRQRSQLQPAANSAQQPPILGEEPYTQQNQSQRQSVRPCRLRNQACGVHQEQNAQADQNHGRDGNLRSPSHLVLSPSGTEH